MRGENKHDDPMFLLPFLNVLCMAINYAKFEKNLDSSSFSRELPKSPYFHANCRRYRKYVLLGYEKEALLTVR